MRSACCHGPNQFANASLILDLHGGLEFCNGVGIIGSSGAVEIFYPILLSRYWGRSIIGDVQFAKPRFEVFTAKLVDVGVAVNLDVIPHLYHVNPVEHVQEPLTLDRHSEFLVKHVEEDIRSTLVRRANGKVIDLMFEEDALPINDPGVEAGFMNRWHEAQFLEDSIGMLFSKLW